MIILIVIFLHHPLDNNVVCFYRSKAESVSLRNTIMWEFPFGLQYAWMLLIFAMTTAMSLSCPLITPFGNCLNQLVKLTDVMSLKYSNKIEYCLNSKFELKLVLVKQSFTELRKMLYWGCTKELASKKVLIEPAAYTLQLL